MRGTIEKVTVLNRELVIYLPPNYNKTQKSYPVAYSHDGAEMEKLIPKFMDSVEEDFEKGELRAFIGVGIYTTPEKRQDEYTPWPAPAIMSKTKAFGGKGEDYIHFIVDEIKPWIDEKYRTLKEPESTWMMGYSLGGLIAIYSAYVTDCFGRVASVCGSLWYEGLVEWSKNHPLKNPNVSFYVYYGEKEGGGKNKWLKEAINCTKALVEDMRKEKGRAVECRCDEGGHYHFIEARYEKAFRWLCQKKI